MNDLRLSECWFNLLNLALKSYNETLASCPNTKKDLSIVDVRDAKLEDDAMGGLIRIMNKSARLSVVI